MEPTGSHFRRPPPRASFSPRRSRFGPVRAAPQTAPPRPPRGSGNRRNARARGRRFGAIALYAVAALALLGAALALTGHEPAVVIGLGLTRFSDALAAGHGNAHALAALAHAALVGGFVALGRLAERGRWWPLAAGAAVYALDGLIVLAAHDWVAIAIHTALLVVMVSGLESRPRFA